MRAAPFPQGKDKTNCFILTTILPVDLPCGLAGERAGPLAGEASAQTVRMRQAPMSADKREAPDGHSMPSGGVFS